MKQLEIAEWVNLGWIYHAQGKRPAQREYGAEMANLKDELFELKLLCVLYCIVFALFGIAIFRYTTGW